ncbi:hypothetical protein HYT26_02330 [Candidatus Pacearchaeota archaeon]|nr:hypothetical protein [Candidatus Pacearchaeota archaeon]
MKTPMPKAALIFLLLCGLAGSAFADGNIVTCSSSTAVLNRYVFRGYEISSNSIVVQPSITMSYNSFSATLWGNIDSSEHATQYFIPGRPGESNFNETDFTLAYTHNIEKFSITGGYAYYAMDYSILGDTEEVLMAVSYNVFTKPTLSVYRDIAEFPGTYLNFSLSHSMKFHQDTTFDLGASVGYCIGDGNWCRTYQPSTGSYDGERYKGFHDGMLKLGLTIPLTEKMSIQPLVQYWFPLSSGAGRSINGVSYNPSGKLDETFVAGVNVNYSF